MLRGGAWHPSFDEIARQVDVEMQDKSVLRDGAWGYSRGVRSASRYKGAPGDSDRDNGVRVVLSASTR